MAVTLGTDVLRQYTRISLYNSPYVAHERGRAIDLYPPGDDAPSPVTGEVLETKAVSAPSKPFGEDEDYLLLVDTGEYVARILHVEPTVEPGERITLGDHLGTLVRSGYFAPWVPNHLHLGFRPHDVNPYRASGSRPISLDVDLHPLHWDGTGTVVETGDTWARLDAPAHPSPGQEFAGLGVRGGVLDGGFPHYPGGGLLGGGTYADGDPVTLLDTRIGILTGRDVTWRSCTVTADGSPVAGLSLYLARDAFGVRIVGDAVDLSVGDPVSVEIVV